MKNGGKKCRGNGENFDQKFPGSEDPPWRAPVLTFKTHSGLTDMQTYTAAIAAKN
jgi:hypothetical protein